MYAAAINRPSPATRSPAGGRRSRVDGVTPASWPPAYQAAATLTIHVTPAAKGAILPNAVHEPASS